MYSTGTVSVTNGSAAVTGAGTAWTSVIRPGWLLVIGGVTAVVASVESATALTLTRNWQGATQAGAGYDALPTQGELAPFVADLQTLLAGMGAVQTGPGQGKFPDGSAPVPGIRFAADEDTGLRRPGANRATFVTGGADRLEVNNAGAILTGLLTGTAVTQNDTDVTTGRLLKAGDYGLGRNIAGRLAPSNNLNNAISSGWWDFDSSTVNRPTGWNNGVVEVASRGTNRVVQIAYRAQGQSEPEAAIRVQFGATDWSPWRPLTPERGSNANGTYVRFADGTQICRSPVISGDVTTATGSLFRLGSAVTWNLPASFANTDFSVLPSGSGSNASTHWANARPLTVSTVECQIFAPSSISGRSVRFTAIGQY